MPGSWGHLARRFFWSIRVAPLSPAELEEVEALVDGPVLAAFLDQGRGDQRHGWESADAVTARGGRRELAVAALLHDIGKRGARLGVAGRVLASVCARLRIPVFGRLAAYLDHPRIGADELAALGVEGLAVTFTRHHHGERPNAVSPEDWALLVAADTTVTRANRTGK
ncbi:MAG TPA: hypothetical protein VMS74_03165 [Acidimicrobiia bacterium]|nr:hypothetical protein [Acidimicrobiia bacterium]